MPFPMNLLAFDTSTETLSLAVARGDRVWAHSGPGGPQASASLIPAVLDLLGQAGLALGGLDAIVFGRGPGSFTGLRTACAVAQGLGFGAAVPLLPVDTLLAVAEEARHGSGAARVLAVLDARMDQVYAQGWAWQGGAWQALQAAQLSAPEQVALPGGAKNGVLAGNAFAAYGERLPTGWPRVPALPTATALLRLAPALLAAGQGVPAEQALPLYVRDKVAQTTAERAALKPQV